MTSSLSATASLDQLRDIHLPAPVSPWPPAPGWWILAVLLALSGYGLWRWYRQWRRQTPLRQAQHALAQLRRQWQPGQDARPLLGQVSILLKRVALTHYPHRDVAGLCGESWLNFLDETGGNGAFSNGPGRLLAQAPYQTSCSADPSPTLLVAQLWLRQATKWRKPPS